VTPLFELELELEIVDDDEEKTKLEKKLMFVNS